MGCGRVQVEKNCCSVFSDCGTQGVPSGIKADVRIRLMPNLLMPSTSFLFDRTELPISHQVMKDKGNKNPSRTGCFSPQAAEATAAPRYVMQSPSIWI